MPRMGNRHRCLVARRSVVRRVVSPNRLVALRDWIQRRDRVSVIGRALSSGVHNGIAGRDVFCLATSQ